ncbi:MAG: N-6 DNA methylase [Candidatus Absconditabacterales bacterium]
MSYIHGFSQNMQETIEKFKFDKQIDKLKDGNLLYLIIERFNKVDLSLEAVSNHDMGYIFEELIRKFSEMSNETAGEHYTPREIIQLMVNIIILGDEKILKTPFIIRSVYDPACGTGGMLTIAKDTILEKLNSKAEIQLFGQEINDVTYAVAKSDMLIKGENADNIKGGDNDHSKSSTLSNDQFRESKFDYILSNPPYGVDWKKDQAKVEEEALRGYAGRFGAGTPRISDGQLLFLQHMISKMKPTTDGGSKIALVFNGSPLFTGDAGSGESEIRRWVLENDRLDTIIGLPDQLFYNTGISTYIWILSNRKAPAKKGKVKLIDARTYFKKMRKSLGNKRHEISPDDIQKICDLYKDDIENSQVKIFKTTDFAFRQITIERPLKDEKGNVVEDKKGVIKSDSELRDTENVPYYMDVDEYFEKEVKPYVPDAWINKDKKYCDHKDNNVGKIGYEISFTRYFYTYQPPRALEEIESDIEKVENELLEMIKKL